MTEDKIRLSKIMSERGMCSRREADEYIQKGWVYVDGEKITTLGFKALPDCRIQLKKENEAVTILLNKPLGYVSSQPEPDCEPAIRLITLDNHYTQGATHTGFRLQREHFKKLAVAGRLDVNSTGLLVFTQDGRIAKQLLSSGIEKEYLVRVRGLLKDLSLLQEGLSLDGVKLKKAQVEWINEDQLRFILIEGKKRQIRRMCELVGLEVLALKRVRIGKVRLGKLPLGQWRYLEPDEVF